MGIGLGEIASSPMFYPLPPNSISNVWQLELLDLLEGVNENMKTIKRCHPASFWHHACPDGLVEIQDLGELEVGKLKVWRSSLWEFLIWVPFDGRRKPYFHRQLKDTILQPLDI